MYLTSIIGRLTGRTGNGGKYARRTGVRLSLERLESRDVLSTLDLSVFPSTVNVAVLSSDPTGYTLQTSGGDANTYTGITSLIGNGGPLTGEPANSTFTVSSINGGTYDDGQGNGTLAFSAAYQLIAGASTNVFDIANNASGIAHGIIGSGSDTLSYAGRTQAAVVNLNTGLASATGGISGFSTVQGTSGGSDILIGSSSGGVTLDGGSGNEVLVGMGGGNTLVTSTASNRNVVILGGGVGNSVTLGSTGGDIVIAGHTIYDQNTSALNAIRQEWLRTDTGYSTRIGQEMGTISGGFNGSYLLKTGNVITTGTAVNVSTTTVANSGQNWYVAKANSIDFSFFSQRKKSGETLTAE